MSHVGVSLVIFFALWLPCFPSRALAGNCDCKPEIDNASAVVISACGKIWSDNHCILKESGATSSSSRTVGDNFKKWETRAYSGLPDGGKVDGRSLTWSTW